MIIKAELAKKKLAYERKCWSIKEQAVKEGDILSQQSSTHEEKEKRPNIQRQIKVWLQYSGVIKKEADLFR